MTPSPFGLPPDPRAAAIMQSAATPPAPEPELPAIEEQRDPAFEQDPITEKGDLKELGKDLKNEFLLYKDARTESGIEDDWTRAELIYESLPYYDVAEGTSQYFLREVYRQVQTKNALFVAKFFSGRMVEFNTKHFGEEDNAEVAAARIRWQLNNFGNWTELDNWGSMKSIYGTSTIRYGWSTLKRTKWKMTRIMDKWVPVVKRKAMEFIQDAPYVKYVDHRRIYNDLEVDNIQDSPFVWEEADVSDEYILTMAREGLFDIGQVKKALAQKGSTKPFDDTNTSPTQWRSRDTLLKKDLRRLVLGWTNGGIAYAFIDTDHEEGPVVVQANENIYGTAPLLSLRNDAKPGFFYGKGDPIILEAQDRFLKEVTGRLVDAMSYEYNPAMVARDNNIKKQLDRAKFLAGEVFDAGGNDPNGAIVPLQLNSGKTEGLIGIGMNFIIPNMESTTGINKELTGGGDHRTSSGIKMKMQGAELRFSHDIKKAMPTVKALYDVLYQLNGRFGSAEFNELLDGPGHSFRKTYGPEVFSPQVDVDVLLADDMMPPEMKQQKVMAAIQTVMNGPSAPLWNPKPLQLEFARAFGSTRPAEWIADPSKTQQNAMEENENFRVLGYVWEAVPHDNHALHIQIHQMALQLKQASPEYQQMPPEAQKAICAPLMQHIEQHQAFMQAQGQMAPSGSPESPDLLGGVEDQAGDPGQAMGNDIGEAMAMNAATGAAQQGAIPQ